jgi:RNA polymerase sigma factor (TIGR02999 family)
MPPLESLTTQLRLYANGHKEYAQPMLLEMWPRLRQIAAGRLSHERYPSFTPTELIGETWLTRLHRGGWTIDTRENFFGVASLAMKFVLADNGRKRLTSIRGGGVQHVSIEEAASELRSSAPSAEQVLMIGMLMDDLKEVNPKVASIVHLHYIEGYQLEQIADETGLTLRQVRHRWSKGKVWLATRLQSKRR